MTIDVGPGSVPTISHTGNVKLSRYRSVRKAQVNAREEKAPPLPPPPPIPESAPEMETIKRSMSRYRRAKPPGRPKQDAVASGRRDSPTTQAKSLENRSPREEQYKFHVKPAHPYPDYPSDAMQRQPRGLMNMKPDDDEDVPLGTLMEQQARRKERPMASSTEGREVLAKEEARLGRMRAAERERRAERDQALEAEKRKKEEAEEAILRLERERVVEEVRSRKERQEEKERAIREKEAAKQQAKEEKLVQKARLAEVTASSSRDASDSRHTTSQGSGASPESSKRVGNFFRRRKDDETPPASINTDDRRPKTSHVSPPKWGLLTIKPGGGGIVPNVDAPFSGLIGETRRVKIVFGGRNINLPVDATTSAQQLIKSATLILPDNLNPRKCILYEYYSAQGIRRPLRMYETIRPIMNSWEDDLQNNLVIEESDLDSNQELYEAHAPHQHQLKEFSGWLKFGEHGKYHDKWVVLRTDGQITVAKNESGKHVANVCNVSDFDIYHKIPDSGRRRSSKKTFMAIKSQQKSAMFMDMADFIHHFYSEDRRVADEFFRAVQDWRSAWIVTRVGTAREQQAAHGETHARSRSAGSNHMLGDFKGLDLDFENFLKPPGPIESLASTRKPSDENKPLGTFDLILPSAQEHSKLMQSRQLSVRRDGRRAPPTSMRHGIPSRPGGRDDALQALNANGHPRQSHDSNRSGDDFNSHGPLGSQHDQRRHHPRPSQDQSGGPQRSASIRSARSGRRNSFDSATIGRRESMRRPGHDPDFGKPLLDFTPQYHAPPQFSRKGKGFHPDQAACGGLIENATGRDNPLGLPGTDDWRARPRTSAGPGLDRAKSINRSRSTRRGPNGTVLEESEGFTGGLLSKNRAGLGDGSTGHGLLSGNHAKGPMLDVHEHSQFESGSLLRQMEKGHLGNPSARDEPWRVG